MEAERRTKAVSNASGLTRLCNRASYPGGVLGEGTERITIDGMRYLAASNTGSSLVQSFAGLAILR